MKKKITMICVLKSGVTIEDTIKIDTKINTQAIFALDEMRKSINHSLGYEKPAVSNIVIRFMQYTQDKQ